MAKVQFSSVLPPSGKNWELNWQLLAWTELELELNWIELVLTVQFSSVPVRTDEQIKKSQILWIRFYVWLISICIIWSIQEVNLILYILQYLHSKACQTLTIGNDNTLGFSRPTDPYPYPYLPKPSPLNKGYPGGTQGCHRVQGYIEKYPRVWPKGFTVAAAQSIVCAMIYNIVHVCITCW